MREGWAVVKLKKQGVRPVKPGCLLVHTSEFSATLIVIMITYLWFIIVQRGKKLEQMPWIICE